MRRLRTVQVFALSLVLMVLGGGVAHSQVELEPVVTGRGADYNAFANDTYVVYTRWTRAKGDVAFAKPLAGGATMRINAAGKNGITGGIDPGTNRVLYQQYSNRGSDLFFYDLDTGERSRVPGVNTRHWEFGPRISSRFIAFAHDRVRRTGIYSYLFVYERESGVRRTLGTWREPPVIEVGPVGDRYLGYTLCTRRNCFAYLYDWETDTSVRIPTVSGQPQYAPVVDEVNATVYFTRSGLCERNASIWRLPIDLTGEATRILNLPRGIDTGWVSSLTANSISGGMDLYIERWDCARRTGDVYVARGVDAEPMV